MNLYEPCARVWQGIHRRVFSLFMKSQFGEFGNSSRIGRPLSLTGVRNIFIGKGVFIRDFAWMMALADGITHAEIRIGDGTYIGHSVHIVAKKRVTIGRKVMIADRVYIGDNIHGYEDPGLPVIDQPLRQLPPVEIGEGAWIGEGTCVIGVKVGKHSVIGANSVVTRDIPDYCVAVGAPARVVKIYDPDCKSWVSVRNTE